MSFQNLKFQVENEEQATALQEWLFSQGYKWVSGHDGKPKHVKEKYFTCYEDGEISILYGDSYFAPHENKEMKLEFSNKLSVESAEIARPFKYVVVMFNEKLQPSACSFDEISNDYPNNFSFNFEDAEKLQKKLSERFPDNYYFIISVPNK